jgi:energy-coupling factor transporter ATP-binding protein EcfA2
VPWSDFTRKYYKWKPGEHVTVVAPTGHGKTVLLAQLAQLREFTTVFATKPRDTTMDYLIEAGGFEKYPKWPTGSDPEKHPRRVVWPDATDLDKAATLQKEVFAEAFSKIYGEGGWTLVVDELWYVTNILNLGEKIKTYLLQARSLDISLVVATQRPAAVPVECYDQASWLFIGRDNDRANLDRIAGIGSVNSAAMRPLVANLEQFQFLVVETRTGAMYRTRTPPPPRGMT